MYAVSLLVSRACYIRGYGNVAKGAAKEGDGQFTDIEWRFAGTSYTGTTRKPYKQQSIWP